jgi:dephospho-CoA kinase
MLITIEQLCKKYGIAITGGIATGKSTITKWLAQIGYQTYDADQIAHSLLLTKEKKTFLKIIETFGEKVTDENGRINKETLKQIIFSDSKKKDQLEQILHPAIKKKLEQKIKTTQLYKNPQLWFYEASLIYETKSENLFREVWVTHCPQNIQLSRLISRDNCSKNSAESIINSQWNNEKKAMKSNFVLNTTLPLFETKKDVLKKLRSLEDNL